MGVKRIAVDLGQSFVGEMDRRPLLCFNGSYNDVLHLLQALRVACKYGSSTTAPIFGAMSVTVVRGPSDSVNNEGHVTFSAEESVLEEMDVALRGLLDRCKSSPGAAKSVELPIHFGGAERVRFTCADKASHGDVADAFAHAVQHLGHWPGRADDAGVWPRCDRLERGRNREDEAVFCGVVFPYQNPLRRSLYPNVLERLETTLQGCEFGELIVPALSLKGDWSRRAVLKKWAVDDERIVLTFFEVDSDQIAALSGSSSGSDEEAIRCLLLRDEVSVPDSAALAEWFALPLSEIGQGRLPRGFLDEHAATLVAHYGRPVAELSASDVAKLARFAGRLAEYTNALAAEARAERLAAQERWAVLGRFLTVVADAAPLAAAYDAGVAVLPNGDEVKPGEVWEDRDDHLVVTIGTGWSPCLPPRPAVRVRHVGWLAFGREESVAAADWASLVQRRAAGACGIPRSRQEAGRREVDKLFAQDAARAAPNALGAAGARARKVAVIAAIEVNDLSPHAASWLLEALRRYEEGRPGSRFCGSDAIVRMTAIWNEVASSAGPLPDWVTAAWRAYERARSLP